MTCIVVCRGENKRTTVLRYYKFVFAFAILTPEALGVYEEFSAVA
jgi:hypothetical protein